MYVCYHLFGYTKKWIMVIGYELTKNFRALELTCAAQIPIILLSKPKSIWESEREEKQLQPPTLDNNE
jgi:hypothetical protein